MAYGIDPKNFNPHYPLMRIVLFLLAIPTFLIGAGILVGAQSAIHEIESGIAFLISAVFLTGASIVDAIVNSRKRIEKALGEPAKSIQPQPPVKMAKPVAVVPPERRYYISIDGKDTGPYSFDEMRELRKSGQLSDDTLVIRQGDTDWQPASMFSEFGAGPT